MSEFLKPVSDDEIHAYVDDQLQVERRSAVKTYLDENTEAAERVAAYEAQRAAIRAAFASHLTEPLPEKLSLARIIAERNTRRPQIWLLAASVAFALGIGLAGGYLLHATQGQTQNPLAFLEQEAFTSHVVYAVDRRHPIEVSSAETPHLQQWLSNRLDRMVVAPDLSALGFHLIGGRLLATERGEAAALLMYDDADHRRISLLLRPMAPAMKMPSAMIERNGVNGSAWIGNGLGVAVVAKVPADDIARLATQIGADLGSHG
jgi:anti-sigma factor RsiW